MQNKNRTINEIRTMRGILVQHQTKAAYNSGGNIMNCQIFVDFLIEFCQWMIVNQACQQNLIDGIPKTLDIFQGKKLSNI